MTDFLLIARKHGRSASRRQRRFPPELIDVAVTRWRQEGFNVWWLYGKSDPHTDTPRPLLCHWRDSPKEAQ